MLVGYFIHIAIFKTYQNDMHYIIKLQHDFCEVNKMDVIYFLEFPHPFRDILRLKTYLCSLKR